MPRLNTVELESATGEAKEILTAINNKYGMVPNIFKGIANSPAALASIVGLTGPMENGVLTPQEREVITLTVSQINGCEYCLAAHTAVGQMVGFSKEETLNIRRGKPSDAKHKALVDFIKAVIETKGFISDDTLNNFRDAGYSDAAVSEVMAGIAYKTFTNYFNHVNETVTDFPEAEKI